MRENSAKKLIISVTAVMLSAALLFVFLYRYDNKYTHGTPQPICGIWDLRNEAFTNTSLFFPIYDWEFYRDVLLSPQDFENGRPDINMEYITIGERTSISDSSAFGKGTFRLNLLLPEREQSYTLYLPEIFNCYRLYVNDKIMLDVGNIESGETEIQKRAVTFNAGSEAQIILSVNSSSHFYSGMVYPPAFGTPFAVNTARGIHTMIDMTITIICFICLLLSGWLSFFTKQKHVRLFVLLCAAITIYTFYPAVHTFIPVSNMLSYTVEIMAFYLIFLFIMLLNNNICELPRIWRIINIAVGTGITIAAVCLSLFSKWIYIDARNVFSLIIEIYKWCFALDLLCSSVYAIYNNVFPSRPLLYGTVFFFMALVFDRVFPLFEPIYSRWFIEIGMFVYAAIFGFIVWCDITDTYRFNLIFAEQKRQMERQITVQKEHYAMISSKIEETRKLHHDIRQHLRVMQSFIHKKQYNELAQYLSEIESTEYESSPLTLCKNSLIDALLQYYGTISIKREIDFDVRLSAQATLPIADVDISVLLGNLLENAYEACLCIKDKNIEKWISVHGIFDDSTIKLQIKNSTDTAPQKQWKKGLSTKHSGNGIGLRSVRAVVEKYNGIIDIIDENHCFSVSIIISFQ